MVEMTWRIRISHHDLVSTLFHNDDRGRVGRSVVVVQNAVEIDETRPKMELLLLCDVRHTSFDHR